MVHSLKEEAKETRKPGVVLYFEIRPAFRFMTDEQKGKLFEAILDYGEIGQEPEFTEDPLLGAVWCLIRPRIDRDGEIYGEKKEQRKYANYCREAKRSGINPISFDDWKSLSEDERKRSIIPDDRKVSNDNDSVSSNNERASKESSR